MSDTDNDLELKRGPGRPPEITKEWADEQAETLADMFAGGESVPEVAAKLNICKTSFYKATKISTEFMNSYKRGLSLSEAWWSRLGRVGAAGKIDIQPTTWIFNMKNRFGWKDRIETMDNSVDPDSGKWEIEFVSTDADPEDAVNANPNK